jgi:hypothetical protein
VSVFSWLLINNEVKSLCLVGGTEQKHDKRPVIYIYIYIASFMEDILTGGSS